MKRTYQSKIVQENSKPEFDKIKKAFTQLRRLGYFARTSFKSDSSSALSEIESQGKDARYVYFARQGKKHSFSTGIISLHWNGDSEEIIKELREQGLTVDHPDELSAIHVVIDAELVAKIKQEWEQNKTQPTKEFEAEREQAVKAKKIARVPAQTKICPVLRAKLIDAAFLKGKKLGGIMCVLVEKIAESLNVAELAAFLDKIPSVKIGKPEQVDLGGIMQQLAEIHNSHLDRMNEEQFNYAMQEAGIDIDYRHWNDKSGRSFLSAIETRAVSTENIYRLIAKFEKK